MRPAARTGNLPSEKFSPGEIYSAQPDAEAILQQGGLHVDSLTKKRPALSEQENDLPENPFFFADLADLDFCIGGADCHASAVIRRRVRIEHLR